MERYESEKESRLDSLYFEQESDNNKEEGTRFCNHCGQKIGIEQKFCPNCGKSCEAVNVIKYCNGCGEILDKNVKFCSKCGTKVPAKIDININGAEKIVQSAREKMSLKKISIIAAMIIAVALMVVIGKNVIPKIFVSTETLLSIGDYQKALSKAKKDEKNEILIENLISNICKEAEDNLRDPSSFNLRDAWYESSEKKRIVLSISGKNGMGGTVTNYWLYTYDSGDDRYELYTTISDMKDEEYKSYDDKEDKLEKLLNNLSRSTIREIIDDDNKIDKVVVERINGLHSEDLLKDVELLEEVKSIYPSEDDGNVS